MRCILPPYQLRCSAKRQLQRIRYPRGRMSCSFGTMLLWTGLLALIARIPCLANDIAIAGRDSWSPPGLFCFRTITGTNQQIHLAQYKNGRIAELFARDIGCSVMFPICLSNGVVAVSSDGVVRKLDLNGNVTFATKPAGFKGASAMSGKLNETCIFMTEALYETHRKRWHYSILLVDVSKMVPAVKARFDTAQPFAIACTSDELVVIGRKDTLRFRIPGECTP